MKEKLYYFLEKCTIFSTIFVGSYFFFIKWLKYDKLFGFNNWAIFFVSILLFAGRNLIFNKILKPVALIFVLFPATAAFVRDCDRYYSLHLNHIAQWIITATLVGGILTAYKFSGELLRAFAVRTYEYIYDGIGNLFFRLKIKLFSKRKEPCKIDYTLDEIDKFGNGNTYEAGHRFEDFVADLYRTHGYEAYTTTELRAMNKLPGSIQKRGGSGEQGVDVMVKIPNTNKNINKSFITLAIQCKHYSSNVSNSAVQEIHSALKLYQADQGCVITNSHFTKAAIELAESNNVILIDREGLAEIIELVKKKYYFSNDDESKSESKNDNPANENKKNDSNDLKNILNIYDIGNEKKSAVKEHDSNIKKQLNETSSKENKNPKDAFWEQVNDYKKSA